MSHSIGRPNVPCDALCSKRSVMETVGVEDGVWFQFKAGKVQSVASHNGKVIPCYHIISNKVEQDRKGSMAE